MEKRIKQLPIFKKRLFILYLKYLLFLQNSEKYVTLLRRAFVDPPKPLLDKMITHQVHYIGRPAASIIYPERRKYAVRFLWYRVYLWVSVDRDANPPLL